MNKNHFALLALSLATCGSLPNGCKQTEITVLTYNVHGLPEGFSDGNPKENMPAISPLLNSYDIVAVQEDFFYHNELSSATGLPYGTPPELYIRRKEETLNPSGLSLFSYFPVKNYFSQRWVACNGYMDQLNDCLAPKGVSVAEIEVISGVWIDVYNCHMDAGDSAGDKNARDLQIMQLVHVLDVRSPHRAVVVACDTNIEEEFPSQLEQMLTLTGLKDSCRELNCPEPGNIDRVFYRSGNWVQLEPTRWYIPDEFVNDRGEDLSDHRPVVVDFQITVAPAYLVR
ncbi:hypothetical protein HY494_02355 [Candidatus Woesearchaeota archaeon]|nr:hypothetical protein [Candidatus Woesearchaeota archaeon]